MEPRHAANYNLLFILIIYIFGDINQNTRVCPGPQQKTMMTASVSDGGDRASTATSMMLQEFLRTSSGHTSCSLHSTLHQLRITSDFHWLLVDSDFHIFVSISSLLNRFPCAPFRFVSMLIAFTK